MSKQPPITGTGDTSELTRAVDVPFDDYIIKVRLDANGKFIGIESISIKKKDFLSIEQNNTLSGIIDVSEFYE